MADENDFAALTSVGIDAWTGSQQPTSAFGASRDAWSVGASLLLGRQSAAPTPPDAADWRDPRVGWGLILPHREGLTQDQLATADDAPEPIRDLLAARPASIGAGRAGWTPLSPRLAMRRDSGNWELAGGRVELGDPRPPPPNVKSSRKAA